MCGQTVRACMFFGKDMMKGENPVHHERLNAYGLSFRVALAGMPAQIAWYIPCEAQYLLESDSEQVP